MAHWAKIDDATVVSVIVTNNNQQNQGYNWIAENLGGTWVQTSYNTYGGVHYTDGEPSTDQTQALRFNYAGIGYTYDVTRDAFIPPTPYPSWVLDEGTCLWVAPVPMPTDGATYAWDEAEGDWVEVIDETI
jgi:hypothetical protein